MKPSSLRNQSIIIGDYEVTRNIIYKVDEKGERISDNFRGEIYDSSDSGMVWMKIQDEKGENISLKRNEIINYSHYDMNVSGYYIVVDPNVGFCKLKPFKIKSLGASRR